MVNRVSKIYNYSSREGARGFGIANSELIAAPMTTLQENRAAVGRLADPDTVLVTLAQKLPTKWAVLSELSVLAPYFRKRARVFVPIRDINLPELVEGESCSLFKNMLLRQFRQDPHINIDPAVMESWSFRNLRANVRDTMRLLEGAVDFSKNGGVTLIYVAPHKGPGLWHKDGKNRGYLRAVRNLNGLPMEVSLEGDHEHVPRAQKKNRYRVFSHGVTSIGVHVFPRHPDEGCPLHRTPGNSSSDPRWGYSVDAVRLEH